MTGRLSGETEAAERCRSCVRALSIAIAMACACAARPPRPTTATLGQAAARPALAVDRDGVAGIAFVDRAGQFLYVEPGGAPSRIDTGGLGWSPSLAFDRAGGVHVVYFDRAASVLKYAFRPRGGAWTSSVIEQQELDHWARLAITPAGDVHVIYGVRSGEQQLLRHARRSAGGGWQSSTIATATVVAGELGVDRRGHVHVVSIQNTRLEYARDPDGPRTAWTAVDPATNATLRAMLVDGSDRIQIVYSSIEPSPTLWHATMSAAGTWSSERLDRGASYFPVALATDHVVYIAGWWSDGFEPGRWHAELHHAYRSTRGWTAEQVDAPLATTAVALAVDETGTIHLVAGYADGTLEYRAVASAHGAQTSFKRVTEARNLLALGECVHAS